MKKGNSKINNRIPKDAKEKVNNYVSPYIKNSQKLAIQRAQQAKIKERSKKPWDDGFAKNTIDYFDGQREKNIIFKIQPNNSKYLKNNQNQNQNHDNINESYIDNFNNHSPVKKMTKNVGNNPSFESKLRKHHSNISTNPPSPLYNNLFESETKYPTNENQQSSPSNNNNNVNNYGNNNNVNNNTPISSPNMNSKLSNNEIPLPSPLPQYNPQSNFIPNQYLPPQLEPEPQIIRVRTRGTSPMHYDENIYNNNNNNNNVNNNSSNKIPSNYLLSKDDSNVNNNLKPPLSDDITRENKMESLIVRILDSHTKIQEVNGEMIGKVTNLVSEMGKIVIVASEKNKDNNSTKFKKNKKVKNLNSLAVVQSSLLSHSSLPLSSEISTLPTNERDYFSNETDSIQLLKTNKKDNNNINNNSNNNGNNNQQILIKKNSKNRKNINKREEILDHILERLSYLEKSESILSKEIQQLDNNSKLNKDINSPILSTSSANNLTSISTPTLTSTLNLNKNLNTNKNAHVNTIKEKDDQVIEEKLNEFIIPPVLQTYDINADINMMSEVGSGWLMLDGKEDVRIKNPLIQTSDKQNSLIPLRADATLKQDLIEFRKNQKINRKIRESTFRAHNVKLCEVANRISEKIVDNLLEETAKELDLVFTNLAENFLNKI